MRLASATVRYSLSSGRLRFNEFHRLIVVVAQSPAVRARPQCLESAHLMASSPDGSFISVLSKALHVCVCIV